MEPFDDIQIEETVGFDYGDYADLLNDEEEDCERSFFNYLNSTTDY